MRGSLAHKQTFLAVVSVLLLLSSVNLYMFRHDFSVLARLVLQREDRERDRWQQWAQHYDRLFGMVRSGERVGIQLEGYRSVGIVLERAPEGMVARRSLFLWREKPGVILTLQRRTAKELLATVPQTAPEAIWQMMKDRLSARQITLWSDPDVERLHKGGYLAFMRAIDTRPPNMDWQTVKGILEEK